MPSAEASREALRTIDEIRRGLSPDYTPVSSDILSPKDYETDLYYLSVTLRRYLEKNAGNPALKMATKLVLELRFIDRITYENGQINSNIAAMCDMLERNVPPQLLAVAFKCSTSFQWKRVATCPFQGLRSATFFICQEIDMESIEDAPVDIFEALFRERITDIIVQEWEQEKTWKKIAQAVPQSPLFP